MTIFAVAAIALFLGLVYLAGKLEKLTVKIDTLQADLEDLQSA